MVVDFICDRVDIRTEKNTSLHSDDHKRFLEQRIVHLEQAQVPNNQPQCNDQPHRGAPMNLGPDPQDYGRAERGQAELRKKKTNHNVASSSKKRTFTNKTLEHFPVANFDFIKKESNTHSENITGARLHRSKHFAEAIGSYKSALNINIELNRKEAMANSYSTIGRVYQDKSEQSKVYRDQQASTNELYTAINYYIKAMELNRNLGRTGWVSENCAQIKSICRTLNIVPDPSINFDGENFDQDRILLKQEIEADSYSETAIWYHVSEDHYDEAISNYLNARDINSTRGFKEGMTSNYDHLGIACQAINEPELAIGYFENASNLYTGDDRSTTSMANILRNLGSAYESQEQLVNALTAYMEALQINEKLNAVKSTVATREGLAANNGNVGNIYNRKKLFLKAIPYYEKSLSFYSSLNMATQTSKVQKLLNQVRTNINRPEEIVDPMAKIE